MHGSLLCTLCNRPNYEPSDLLQSPCWFRQTKPFAWKLLGVEFGLVVAMATTVARSLPETFSALERPITSLVLLKVPMGSEEEALALATALGNSTKLNALAVDGAEGAGSTDFITRIFRDVLPHSNLREIDLSDIAIGNATAKWVAGALRGTSLKTLGLRRCSLSPEAVRSLAEALHNNLSLTNLNLSGNDLCDVGAAHVAGVLKTNATLQRLGLANCGIGPQAAGVIAEALVANVTLNTLDLGFNNIGDGVAFVEALKVNRSLLALSVDANDTLGVLQVLLRRNRSHLVSGSSQFEHSPVGFLSPRSPRSLGTKPCEAEAVGILRSSSFTADLLRVEGSRPGGRPE